MSVSVDVSYTDSLWPSVPTTARVPALHSMYTALRWSLESSLDACKRADVRALWIFDVSIVIVVIFAFLTSLGFGSLVCFCSIRYREGRRLTLVLSLVLLVTALSVLSGQCTERFEKLLTGDVLAC